MRECRVFWLGGLRVCGLGPPMSIPSQVLHPNVEESIDADVDLLRSLVGAAESVVEGVGVDDVVEVACLSSLRRPSARTRDSGS